MWVKYHKITKYVNYTVVENCAIYVNIIYFNGRIMITNVLVA